MNRVRSRSGARSGSRGRFPAAALALAGLAAASLVAGCAGAPAKPTPQRPTFSRNTSTTAAGTLELEAGVAVDPGDTFDSPVTLKYGVSEDTELFGSMAPYVWEDFDGPNGEGVGDLYLGVRQRFIDVGAEEPTFAYQLQTKIPTAPEDQGIGSGQMDFFAAGIMDYPIEEFWLTTFYQLGIVGEPGGDDDPDIEHGIAFASNAAIDDSLGAYGEIAGVFTPERDDEQIFTTVGLTHPLGEGTVVDAGVLVGLSRDAPDFQITLGITTNFGGGGQQPMRREPHLPRTAPID
jgi:hypothetical protein